jgi:predicted N-acetyltransferase YhbS
VTQIVPLSSQNDAAVEAVLDAAFGSDRHKRTAYRIRLGTQPIPALSFAALDDMGALVGTLQSWPVALSDSKGAAHPLVMVGPVAVLPEKQIAGIGRALTDAMIAAAEAQGCAPLMMIGDPEYYGRFWGFSADATGEWGVPGPVERRRLLARPTRPGQRLPGAGTLGPHVARAAA